MSRTPLPPEGYYLAPHITVGAIQKAVCATFHVRAIDMVSARRCWEYSHPRQVAMYLARELTPYSLPNIGRFFGNRDHTTVMHAIRAVERRKSEDPHLAETINNLINKLEAAATVNHLQEAA